MHGDSDTRTLTLTRVDVMEDNPIGSSEEACPRCGRGPLEPVTVNVRMKVGEKRFRVPGVRLLECSSCKRRVWPESERERARHVLALKIRKG